MQDMITEEAARLYAWLTPAPLSPIFKEGGLLYGFNEDIVMICGFVAMFLLLDRLIVRPIFKEKCWYFALHVVCNTIVVVAAFPDVVRAFTGNPMTVFTGPYTSIMPNNVTWALHVYHCLAFTLRAEDIFHHVLFVGVMCPMGCIYKQIGGASACLGGFFLSGLPGGINYVMLILVAYDVISKETEKRWYTRINVWLRGPSQTVYATIAWVTRVHTDHPIPIAVAVIAPALHFYNGGFYAQQACESNAVFVYKQELVRKGIELPAERLSGADKKKSANKRD